MKSHRAEEESLWRAQRGARTRAHHHAVHAALAASCSSIVLPFSPVPLTAHSPLLKVMAFYKCGIYWRARRPPALKSNAAHVDMPRAQPPRVLTSQTTASPGVHANTLYSTI